MSASDYLVEKYEDAHNDEPALTRRVEGEYAAIATAMNLARNLATEESDLQIGEAGDDELCEVFPSHGHGTVVVRIDHDELPKTYYADTARGWGKGNHQTEALMNLLRYNTGFDEDDPVDLVIIGVRGDAKLEGGLYHRITPQNQGEIFVRYEYEVDGAAMNRLADKLGFDIELESILTDHAELVEETRPSDEEDDDD